MKMPLPMKADTDDIASGQPRYWLRLYISGATPRSTEAIANIKAIGEKRLSGRYHLEVIDTFQQPALIRRDNIVVLPTLVKQLPLPLRRLVGDLCEEARVLVGLDLVPDEEDDPEPAEGIADAAR
jgi:circadian clock protein KaiB